MDQRMEKMPVSGEIYRHYKNNLYQIVTTAKDVGTGEQLVVYQALFGDFGVFAEPAARFFQEVDRRKYPDAAQKRRFEKVERQTLTRAAGTGEEQAEEKTAAAESRQEFREEAAATETADGTETVDKNLMAFLDADDFEEKYNILVSMRDSITDKLVNDMAVVLDVVIPEGNLADRYEALKQCVRTRQRYESMRLR